MEITCICPNLSMISASQLEELVKNSKSDIVVFPEYLLELTNIPDMKTDKLIVWGSKQEDKQNKLYIQLNNQIQKYSKIKLTPWEKDLDTGAQALVLEYKEAQIAFLTCFDIEFPELSVELRKHSIDLLIVPSATETEQGYQRVSRCASARAVELGCAVVTCHLIGETDHPMIDVNVGNHNLFLPAQSLFATQVSEILPSQSQEKVTQTFKVSIEKIREQRTITTETNPAI